jgi:hypothetical protein
MLCEKPLIIEGGKKVYFLSTWILFAVIWLFFKLCFYLEIY